MLPEAIFLKVHVKRKRLI